MGSKNAILGISENDGSIRLEKSQKERLLISHRVHREKKL